MARRYNIISGDSHLDLSPERWVSHVPAKWRGQAPRVVRLESGEDAVLIADRKPAKIGLTRSVGVPRDQMHLQVPTFDNSGGTGGPEKRLQEQTEDGIDAEIMFSRVGIIRAIKDDEGYLALNRAYNEYLAEEYIAAAPDRLIAMGVIPTCGIDAAVAELEYCARAGFKGVLLDRFPSGKGVPTPEDDRFWATALDLGMAITNHTNSGTTRMTAKGEPALPYSKLLLDGRGDPLELLFRFCGDAAFAPVQMGFTGVWDRFPDLRIYWGETMIGWLEYALWQIDDHYERYKYLFKYVWGIDWLTRMPSEYIRDHCMWGFLYDPIGVKRRDAIGAERLIWGSDFAHAASDWPHSLQAIERSFAGVPDDDRYMMLAGNVIRFFHLDNETREPVQAATASA